MMNVVKFLSDLADNQSSTATGATADRRAALLQLARAGGRALAASLPLLATLPAAQAGTQATIPDSLLLAYQLEDLENEFYKQALAQPASFFPAGTRPAIEIIQQHEQQHVNFLGQVLTSSGIALPTQPNYDFTGSRNGGQAAAFPNVFNDFDVFLRLAQTLEDAGVRAYKGQLEYLISDNTILEAAMRIHAVEARHAAQIRTMRRARGATVKSWVSAADTSIVVAGKTEAVYAGEETTTQVLPGFRTVPFSTLPIGNGATILQAVAEAFDEPLDATAAGSLVSLFTY